MLENLNFKGSFKLLSKRLHCRKRNHITFTNKIKVVEYKGSSRKIINRIDEIILQSFVHLHDQSSVLFLYLFSSHYLFCGSNLNKFTSFQLINGTWNSRKSIIRVFGRIFSFEHFLLTFIIYVHKSKNRPSDHGVGNPSFYPWIGIFGFRKSNFFTCTWCVISSRALPLSGKLENLFWTPFPSADSHVDEVDHMHIGLQGQHLWSCIYQPIISLNCILCIFDRSVREVLSSNSQNSSNGHIWKHSGRLLYSSFKSYSDHLIRF